MREEDEEVELTLLLVCVCVCPGRAVPRGGCGAGGGLHPPSGDGRGVSEDRRPGAAAPGPGRAAGPTLVEE